MPKPITAGEYMKRLQADPKWVAANAEREKKRKERRARLDQNQAPLLAALEGVGLKLKSVYDLVNFVESYPEAIPVLLEHLKMYERYDPRVREGIARALTVREAQPVLRELVDAYREDPDTSLNGPKGALGNAISFLADSRYTREFISLALDQSHGKGRCALVRWLGARKGRLIDKALEELASDPDVEVAVRAQDALEKRARKR